MASDKVFYALIWNIGFALLLMILFLQLHNQVISSIRAIGIQCTADYRIDIPTPEIEDIKNGH